MNTQTWKSTWRLILVIGIVCQSTLQAQTTLTLPTTGTAGSGSTAVDFELRTDGTLLEKGSGSTSLSNSDLESASRFIWYPVQSALRAGGGLSTETVSQVGQYSVAMGYQAIASSEASIALGYDVTAGNGESVAIGYNVTAWNGLATAIGGNTTAGGYCATAIGISSNAAGNYSIALAGGLALDTFSTAIGGGTIADGNYSTAIGYASQTWGSYAMSMGTSTIAAGTYSTAEGYLTFANSYDSFAIGTYNLDLSETGATTNPNSWVSTDPLFEIGNGTSVTPSDAFVVYKNGDVDVQGVITCSPGGDIPMYTGN